MTDATCSCAAPTRRWDADLCSGCGSPIPDARAPETDALRARIAELEAENACVACTARIAAIETLTRERDEARARQATLAATADRMTVAARDAIVTRQRAQNERDEALAKVAARDREIAALKLSLALLASTVAEAAAARGPDHHRDDCPTEGGCKECLMADNVNAAIAKRSP